MYTPDHALQAVTLYLLLLECLVLYKVRLTDALHKRRTQLVIAVGAMIADTPLFVGAALNLWQGKKWDDFTPFFAEVKHGAHSVVVWAYTGLILLKLCQKYEKRLTHYTLLFLGAVYLHMLVDFMTHGRELDSHGHSGWWPLCEPCTDGINLGTVFGFWNYMPGHGMLPRWQEIAINILCVLICTWTYPRYHRRRSQSITGVFKLKD